jgi:hypothetical protein
MKTANRHFGPGWMGKPADFHSAAIPRTCGGRIVKPPFAKPRSQKKFYREVAVVVSAVAPEMHARLASRNEKYDRQAA